MNCTTSYQGEACLPTLLWWADNHPDVIVSDEPDITVTMRTDSLRTTLRIDQDLRVTDSQCLPNRTLTIEGNTEKYHWILTAFIENTDCNEPKKYSSQSGCRVRQR